MQPFQELMCASRPLAGRATALRAVASCLNVYIPGAQSLQTTGTPVCYCYCLIIEFGYLGL